MVLPIFLIGNKGVGKSSLINRFVRDDVTAHIFGTRIRRMEIDGKMWKLKICQIDESPYQPDRFCCCVLVYDVNDRASFDSLNDHIDDFVFKAQPDAYKFKYVVLGNKVDIVDRPRAVSESEAREWCYLNRDAIYFETSATEGLNVEAALLQIARCAIGYAPYAPPPLYNLQDVILKNDLSHLTVLFCLSRERWLKASEVYLIEDHLRVLYQYESKTLKLTPGLFLTKGKYWDQGVADLMHGHNWETSYGQLESDDKRGPVEISYASWSRDTTSPTLDRYIYHLKGMKRCLVHYVSR